ncbi:hypothetical protein MMC29_001950 [Sticta canariensis]|nr:hypothetical protein [Sticta canariensis]
MGVTAGYGSQQASLSIASHVESYPVFLAYYLGADHFLGFPTCDYAFIGEINFGVTMLTAPIVTVLTRKFGMQSQIPLGADMLCGGFVSASYTTRIWHLYLTQGVLVDLCVDFIYIPTVPVVSQWFLKRRSLASGVSAAGSGVGGLIFSLATGPMIRNIRLG